MASLYLLIPLAVVFALVAIKLFFWAVKNGQYDDLDTESKRILFDDDPDDLKSDALPGDDKEGQ